MFWKHKDEPEEVNSSAKFQYYHRVVFVGSSSSSDSRASLMQRCTGSKGNPVYKEMILRGTRIILELWDVLNADVDSVNAIVVCYDVTSRESYNSALDEWEGLLKKNPETTKMIVGNKFNLAGNREVFECEGVILADFVGTPLFCEGMCVFTIHF